VGKFTLDKESPIQGEESETPSHVSGQKRILLMDVAVGSGFSSRGDAGDFSRALPRSQMD
jgi:hypothetical protein